MQPNQDMDLLRRQWVVGAPATDLADRILAHALAQPQKQTLAQQWRAFRQRVATPSPAYGFAFAACLMLAVIAYDPQPQREQPLLGNGAMERMVEQFIWDDYTY